MRPWITLLALGAMAWAGRARADDDTERYMLRAELGAEYDSNVHRDENFPGKVNLSPVGSALGRGVVTGTLADVVAPGHDVAMSATAAGKLFEDAQARNEDVAVVQTALTWRMALAERATLSAAGTYYEAFQRGANGITYAADQRDFRSLGGTLRLGLPIQPRTEIAATAGLRSFIFKPDRDFDFDAAAVGLELRWAHESADGAADWEGLVSAGYEHRAFAGPVLINPCNPPQSVGSDCPPVFGDGLRGDDLVTARVEAARTGRLLVGAGYQLEHNASNSFGLSVVRHFAIARFATPLPWDLFLTGRAELLFAHYPEPLVVVNATVVSQTTVNIEDENRSSARLDLSKALGDHLQIIARYTFYGPALVGSPVGYARQTAMLALAFTFEK